MVCSFFIFFYPVSIWYVSGADNRVISPSFFTKAKVDFPLRTQEKYLPSHFFSIDYKNLFYYTVPLLYNVSYLYVCTHQPQILEFF